MVGNKSQFLIALFVCFILPGCSHTQKAIILKEIRTFKKVKVSTNCMDGITSMKFLKENKVLAIGYEDGEIRLWDITTGQILKKFNERLCPVAPVALSFSPDGDYVATAGCLRIKQGKCDPRYRYMSLQDLNSGKTIRKFKSREKTFPIVFSLAFSADRKIIASAGGDDTIKLWDVGDGMLSRELKPHKGFVGYLNFPLMEGILCQSIMTEPSSSGT